jgi:hypothetical protein
MFPRGTASGTLQPDEIPVKAPEFFRTKTDPDRGTEPSGTIPGAMTRTRTNQELSDFRGPYTPRHATEIWRNGLVPDPENHHEN